MEKRKPHHELAVVKAAFAARLRATRTATVEAEAMGFGATDMAAVVAATERRHFVKSMTSYADAKIWQDVYNVPYAGLTLYVKFTTDSNGKFLLISFKDKEE